MAYLFYDFWNFGYGFYCIATKRAKPYIAQRNEEVSRISDGVAGGIIRVFENQNFINALNNGVSINIHINVDGSQNIVITGNSNSILL